MNKNKGVISIGLVLAIVLGIAVIGGGAYYLGTRESFRYDGDWDEWQDKYNAENKNLPIIENEFSASNITCKDNVNYLVVLKSLAPNTGTDILIKYKNTNKKIYCDYRIDETDFEIQDNGNSQYFYLIHKNLLIVDSGTGVNNRGVTIYNLDTRKEIFHDSYNTDGVKNLYINDNTMSYWSTDFKQTVTKQNCPQFYNSGKFVSHFSLDLSTLIKTDLNEHKCVYDE